MSGSTLLCFLILATLIATWVGLTFRWAIGVLTDYTEDDAKKHMMTVLVLGFAGHTFLMVLMSAIIVQMLNR